MAENNKNSKSPQQEYHENAMAFMVISLIAGLALVKNELLIKQWFYNHMLELVFFGFALVGLLGLLIRWRIKKKYKVQIARAQNLRAMKPSARLNDYYRKPGGNFNE